VSEAAPSRVRSALVAGAGHRFESARRLSRIRLKCDGYFERLNPSTSMGGLLNTTLIPPGRHRGLKISTNVIWLAKGRGQLNHQPKRSGGGPSKTY
jgi:hypothetical protein